MFDDTETYFYAAHPTLFIGGVENPALAESLLSLVVDEPLSGPSQCRARFINWGSQADEVGYLYFDRTQLDFGKTLKVVMGEGEPLFEGAIRILEADYPPDGAPEILVVAEDRLADLRAVARTRTFDSFSDAELFARIAGQHGLQADISGPSLLRRHDQISQVDQSDLAFLMGRARRLGVAMWVAGNTLFAHPLEERSDEELELELGSELLSFQVRASLVGQATTLGVSGWDEHRKEPLAETADEGALAGELRGSSGGALAALHFGPRPVWLADQRPEDQEETALLAGIRFRERARRFVIGTGLANGDLRLRAGAQVNLSGLGELFEGRYDVLATRHTFDLENGYQTVFQAGRAWIGPEHRPSGKKPADGKKKTEPEKDAGSHGAETRLHEVIPPGDKKGSPKKK